MMHRNTVAGRLADVFTVAASLIVAPLQSSAYASMPSPKVTAATAKPAITIDASHVLGSISPGLFSNNHRYIDAGTGVLDLSTLSSNPPIVPLRPDLVAWAKDFGITGMRFPGGSESDTYNWYSGIGPVLSRPGCANRAGPARTCNVYGIMEHMAFVEALGADALQWTGMTLARQIRAVDAANFVEFVNAPNDGHHSWAALRASYGHPQPYGVRYWELGNEVTASPTFYPTVDAWLDGYSACGTSMWDGALSVRDAMKAVDPTILVGTGWIPQGTDLYDALQARQTRFDFADIHNGLQGSGNTVSNQHYTGIEAATRIADRTLINQHRIDSVQYPALSGMQVVAWENDAATKVLRYGLHHALTNAVSLTTLIANGITFNSHSPMGALVSSPPTAGARAEDFQFSPSSPPDPSGNQYVNWYSTAPSYTYKLFAKYLGTTSVQVAMSNVPTVKIQQKLVNRLYATAALNSAGNVLGLVVTNADYNKAWTTTIALNGFSPTPGRGATVQQINGADVTTVDSLSSPTNVQLKAAPNTAAPKSNRLKYTFPAHSVTAIDFQGTRAAIAASVSRPTAPQRGGSTLTVNRAGLPGASAVKFGRKPGIASAARPAPQVTCPPVPDVTRISPRSGPEGGGTTVTITGTALFGATAVNFGSTPGTIVGNTDTQITVTGPGGSGTVDVTVTTRSGTSATSPADQFTYRPAPTVGGVSPTSGPEAGGTTVTIDGTGLSAATEVDFGTAPATVLRNTDSQITVTSPSGSGTVDVTVITPGGTSATSSADQFTYVPAPTVDAISPATGPESGGTTVTITGTGLSGASEVDFGATPATVLSNTDTEITVTSPAGSGIVDVTVITSGGTSATSASDQFTYVPAPTVDAISPTSGPESGGTTVTITGTGLSGASEVDFGATPATVLSNTDTEITVTSPNGSGTVDVTVITPGGTSATSAADQFTFVPAPTVDRISPSSGPESGDTTVTITGTGLSGATEVDFGATPATIVSNTDTEITVTSPNGSGTVDVTVITPGGTSAANAADQFTYVPDESISRG